MSSPGGLHVSMEQPSCAMVNIMKCPLTTLIANESALLYKKNVCPFQILDLTLNKTRDPVGRSRYWFNYLQPLKAF